MSKEQQTAAKSAPESPYAAGIAKIEAMQAEQRKKAEAEGRQRRKATKPWLASENPFKTDMLALPAGAAEHNKNTRNMEAAWVREDEVDEYRLKGYTVASKRNWGGLKDDAMPDDGAGIDTTMRRRELVLMECPVGWQAQRIKYEGMVANQQLGDAVGADGELVDERTGRAPGHFGKQPRRPMAALDN